MKVFRAKHSLSRERGKFRRLCISHNAAQMSAFLCGGRFGGDSAALRLRYGSVSAGNWPGRGWDSAVNRPMWGGFRGTSAGYNGFPPRRGWANAPSPVAGEGGAKRVSGIETHRIRMGVALFGEVRPIAAFAIYTRRRRWCASIALYAPLHLRSAGTTPIIRPPLKRRARASPPIAPLGEHPIFGEGPK